MCNLCWVWMSERGFQYLKQYACATTLKYLLDERMLHDTKCKRSNVRLLSYIVNRLSTVSRASALLYWDIQHYYCRINQKFIESIMENIYLLEVLKHSRYRWGLCWEAVDKIGNWDLFLTSAVVDFFYSQYFSIMLLRFKLADVITQ